MNTKHFITLLPIIAAAILANSAYGLSTTVGGGNVGDIGTIARCTSVTCPSNLLNIPYLIYTTGHCLTSGEKVCVSNGKTTYQYNKCKQCEVPYLVSSVIVPECGGTFLADAACKCVCLNCTSDTSYTDAGTGYQKKVKRSCDCSSGTATCVATTVYQCAVGYYGSSTNGTSGCTRCPASGGVYGTTASAGSSSITSCYIPSGSNLSDSTGSGTYTGDCYYSN